MFKMNKWKCNKTMQCVFLMVQQRAFSFGIKTSFDSLWITNDWLTNDSIKKNKTKNNQEHFLEMHPFHQWQWL